MGIKEMHIEKKVVYGFTVVLFQILLNSTNFTRSFTLIIEEMVLNLNDSIPLFFPLFSTVIYASWCRDPKIAFWVGFFSWMAFPIALLIFLGEFVPISALFILIGIGIVYGLIGKWFATIVIIR
jgi:hypothetical protein